MKLVNRLAPFAILIAAFALPSVASAQAQKIGSANVQKVFSDIKETKDLETKLKAQGDALNTQQNALQQKLKALQDNRNQFKPGTETYDRANQELKQTLTRGQIELQIANQDLQTEQKRQTKTIYDKIVAAVTDLAKEKGYSIVVAQIVPPEPSDDQMDQMKAADLINLLRQQNLLYVDPSADLTTAVVTKLDAAYSSTAGTSAAPAPTTPAPAPAK